MSQTSTNGAGAAVEAGAAGLEDQRGVAELGVCLARTLRSEVEVLSRDPDRGNPTLTRQGRGPELTGRSPVRLGYALRGLP